ncbi:S8 family serine peptidase [Luteococcus sp. Sow4_B9]|uniref:S8 family serine peptidase n=1 Tax=Luteococcus sp. Sow4_B9 TaxID=3438792 RepID=UPI003F97D8E5
MHSRMMSGLAATALVASGLCAAPTQARAADPDLGRMSDYIKAAERNEGGKVVANRWLVQVEGVVTAQGGNAGKAQDAQKQVAAAAKRAGVKMKQNRSYTRTFNGMAVTMDTAQAEKLARVPGVKGIYPVIQVDRPVTPGTKTSPSMATAVNLTGAAIVRDDLGHDGEGIKVGVIDSGIDIDHPDFGGNGTNGSTTFPTARVQYGYDFVGDDYNEEKAGSLPVPDAIPDDCGGHGTHVAGIIGADGDPAAKGVTGVAPKVTFGAYRVFGCDGPTSSEVILAAMERAEADGMDVVNMSLGAGMMTWPDYPTAVAADAMADRGTIVVAAAGNDGEDGVFTAGAPSVGSKTIAVASYDNSHVTQWAIRLQANGKLYGYTAADGVEVPRTGNLPVVSLGEPGTPQAQGCEPYTDEQKAQVAGAAVLVQRGTCTFHQKAANAQAAGAAAVLLYNNAAGTLNPSVEGTPEITIPVVMLSQEAGTEIAQQLASGNVMEWTSETTAAEDPNGGRISSFSSWGVGADLSLKPDFGAPGGNIWSTYPLEKGAYTSMSGTSMATPHAAGSIALLLQARPGLKGKAEKVKALLQNTADHDALFSLAPDAGLKEMVIRQGAGMMQLDRALLTQQHVTPSSISLGESEAGPVTVTLNLRNDSKRPTVYTFANEGSVGSVGTSDPSFDVLDAQVDLPKRVVVPPRKTKKVEVTITAPADAPNGYIYGGWIVASSATGATLNVPYMGMAGDYQAVDVLNAPDGSTPCLGEMVGPKDARKPVCLPEQEGLSFSMAEDNQPMPVFRLEYPTEKVQMVVHRANADGSQAELVGVAAEFEHEGRVVGDVGLAWDGSYLTTGSAPYRARVAAGSYILEIKALRALGDAENPEHWQSWTSAPFTARFDAKAPAPGGDQVDPLALQRVGQ